VSSNKYYTYVIVAANVIFDDIRMCKNVVKVVVVIAIWYHI